jgi:hypothetical protein
LKCEQEKINKNITSDFYRCSYWGGIATAILLTSCSKNTNDDSTTIVIDKIEGPDILVNTGDRVILNAIVNKQVGQVE